MPYIRTALAFAVTGGGIIKFLDGVAVGAIGSCLLAVAIGIAALGVVRYGRVSRRIRVGQSAAGDQVTERPPRADRRPAGS